MLPSKNKVLKKSEIDDLAKTGKRKSSVFFNIKTKINQVDEARFIIVVSGKVHKNAVPRNRLRRQVKEIVKQELIDKLSGKDIMIIVKDGCLQADYQEMKKDLTSLLLEK